jgi:hypothetical protein
MKFRKFIDDNRYRCDLIPGRIGPHIEARGKVSIVNAVKGDERLDHFGVWVILFDPAGDPEQPVVMPCDFGQMMPLIRKIGKNKEVDASLVMQGGQIHLQIGEEEFVILLSPFQRMTIRDQFGYL